jgi:hypothetical protein
MDGDQGLRIMSITTTNMGLVKWSELTDPYDHSQLSGNFQRIDEHDHTSGKGARLKGSSLEDESIGTLQIANLSVTDAKLAGGITTDKLAPGVVATIGDFKWWWRPNTSTALPEGAWIICAGQTLSASQHEFAGGGTIIIPNLINKTIFGQEPASIGVIGGVSTLNLEHTHIVNEHSHTVPAHTHFLNLETGYNANTNIQIQGGSGAWVHSDNANNIPHKHSINGSANESGPWVSGPATSTTDSRLGAVSIIPPFVGFLPLLKVKN